MAHCSLNDHSSNQKPLLSTESPPLLDLRDKIYDELRQAAALAVVANSEDFLEFNEPFVRDYLEILQNFVVDALETYKLLDEHLGNSKN
jgi:hypothetical protein